jgi:NAD(P)-dependent dehydrogenase (short-subunit alcohol dehydrogenase family)
MRLKDEVKFMRLKDKVAIITGGGIGIGKAITFIFASEGATVVVAARTLSRLEEVAEDIKSRGGRAKAIQTDISDEKQVQRMVAQTIDEYGQIGILVNNSAAPPTPDANVVDMNFDDWNKTLAVNLTGTMLCCREVLKHMIPRKTGNIINISSVGGISGHPMRSAYAVSKRGIIGLTETLAIEVGKYNIRVNCISPAATGSERFENVIRARAKALGISYEELMSKVIHPYSLKRIAEPSEVATAALFLASDDSSAITGQNLVVSCGFHIMQPQEIR